MDLPYQSATAGQKRQAEVVATLRALGAGAVGIMEDYEKDAVLCQFKLGGRNVTLMVHIDGYVQAWLRENPWTTRRTSTQEQWEKKARAQAEISIWAILADWVKAQATMIYIGALDFDTAFLAHIAAPDGRRMIEVIRAQDTNLLPPPDNQ